MRSLDCILRVWDCPRSRDSKLAKKYSQADPFGIVSPFKGFQTFVRRAPLDLRVWDCPPFKGFQTHLPDFPAVAKFGIAFRIANIRSSTDVYLFGIAPFKGFKLPKLAECTESPGIAPVRAIPKPFSHRGDVGVWDCPPFKGFQTYKAHVNLALQLFGIAPVQGIQTRLTDLHLLQILIKGNSMNGGHHLKYADQPAALHCHLQDASLLWAPKWRPVFFCSAFRNAARRRLAVGVVTLVRCAGRSLPKSFGPLCICDRQRAYLTLRRHGWAGGGALGAYFFPELRRVWHRR